MELSMGQCQCSGDVQLKDDHYICQECLDEVEPCCAACGGQNDLRHSKFPRHCSECGQPFKARTARNQCWKCGAVLDSKRKFCPDCGAPTNAATQIEVKQLCEHKKEQQDHREREPLHSELTSLTQQLDADINATSSSPLREVARSNSHGFFGHYSIPLMSRDADINATSSSQLREVARSNSHGFFGQSSIPLVSRGAFSNATSAGQQFDVSGRNGVSLGNSAGRNAIDALIVTALDSYRNSAFASLLGAFSNSTSTGQQFDVSGRNDVSLGNLAGRNAIDAQIAPAPDSFFNSAFAQLLGDMSITATAGQLFDGISGNGVPQENISGANPIDLQCSANAVAVGHSGRSSFLLLAIPISWDQSDRLIAALSTANSSHMNGSISANHLAVSITHSPNAGAASLSHVANNAGASVSISNDREPEKPQENPSVTPEVQASCREHGTALPPHVTDISVNTLNGREPKKPQAKSINSTEDQELRGEHGAAVRAFGDQESEKPQANSSITVALAHHREYEAAVSVMDRREPEKSLANSMMTSVARAHHREYGTASSANVGGLAEAAVSAVDHRESEKPRANYSMTFVAPTQEHGAVVNVMDRSESEKPQANSSTTSATRVHHREYGTALPAGAALSAMDRRESEKPRENGSMTFAAPTQECGAALSAMDRGESKKPQANSSMTSVAAAHHRDYDTVLSADVASTAAAVVSTLEDRECDKPRSNSSMASVALAEPKDYGGANANVTVSEADTMMSLDGKPKELNEQMTLNPSDQEVDAYSVEHGISSETGSSIGRGAHSDVVSNASRDGKPEVLDERRVNNQGIYAPGRTNGQHVENDSPNVEPSFQEPRTREAVSAKDSFTSPPTREAVSAQDSSTSFERKLLSAPGYLLSNEESEHRSLQPQSVDDSVSFEMPGQSD